MNARFFQVLQVMLPYRTANYNPSLHSISTPHFGPNVLLSYFYSDRHCVLYCILQAASEVLAFPATRTRIVHTI